MLKLVMFEGMKVTLAGVLLGLGGAFALTRLMSGLLFEVSAADPAVYTAIAALLAVTAMVAVCLPARRATRVDPVLALRPR